MNKVILHGKLGQKFGREWNLDTKTVKESLLAINVNTDYQFSNYLMELLENKKIGYVIVVGNEVVNDFNHPILLGPCVGEEINLIPILDINLVWWAYVLISLVMTAISMLLSKPPDINFNDEEEQTVASSRIKLPAQGMPIPIGYGLKLVYPIPICQGIKYADYLQTDLGFFSKIKGIRPNHIITVKEKTDFNTNPLVSQKVKNDIYYSPNAAITKPAGYYYFNDLICEGEIEGLVSGKKGTYINDVVLMNPDSSLNHKKVYFEPETCFKNGTWSQGQFGALIEDEQIVNSSYIILQNKNAGKQLYEGDEIFLHISAATHPDASFAYINIFIQTNYWSSKKHGPQKTPIALRFFVSRNNGPYVLGKAFTNNIKITHGYCLTVKLPLHNPPNEKTIGWDIKIAHTTENKNYTHNDVYCNIFFDSLFVVGTNKFRYPNCALASMQIDTANMQSIPERAYLCKLLKIKIPSNYDPVTRVYSGIWDGTFKAEKYWTDNPAWVFYDLVTNKRYGAGEYISIDSIDKWTLYKIAQYCDELVDNGNGGTEPRFTCNVHIYDSEEAQTLINNFASIFNGIAYWTNNKIIVAQDKSKPIKKIFNNTNVVNGEFLYGSVERDNIHSVAIVKWTDPDDMYRDVVEYVEDEENILKYGMKEIHINTFACSSRGQAHRVGKWALLSEKFETNTVAFETALEGLSIFPGDVIGVYDDYKTKRKLGGRVLSFNNSEITLDRYVEIDNNLNYVLSVTLPKEYSLPSDITNSSESLPTDVSFIETLPITGFDISENGKTKAYVSGSFSSSMRLTTWTMNASHSTSGEMYGAQTFRVLGIEKTNDDTYKISALLYSSGKFADSESGFSSSIGNQINYSNFAISPPTNLQLIGTGIYENQSVYLKIQYMFSGSTGSYVLGHEVDILKSGSTGEWIPSTPTIDGENTQISGEYTANDFGVFFVRARAIQIGGAESDYISGNVEIERTNPVGNDVLSLSSLLLFNYDQNANYYNNTDNVACVSYKYSGIYEVAEENGEALVSEGDLVPDSEQAAILFSLLSGVSVKIFDNNNILQYSGFENTDNVEYENFIYINSSLEMPDWPFRTGKIELTPQDMFGQTGTTLSLQFINPCPGFSSLKFVEKKEKSFKYNLIPSETQPNDFSGILFWVNNENVRPSNPTLTGYDYVGEIFHNFTGNDIYVWHSIKDTFKDDCPIYGPTTYKSNLSIPDSFYISGFWTLDRDYYGNDYPTIWFQWSRFEDTDILGYELFIWNASGIGYSFTVPQTESGVEPYYSFKHPTPSVNYSGYVRAYAADGRDCPWSNISNTIAASQPVTRYLEVQGYSKFFNNTQVQHYDHVVDDSTGSHLIPFYASNIIKLHLQNTSTATLDVGSPVSGSTYLLFLVRESGGGNIQFSNNWLWPDGSDPVFSTTINSVHGISAVTHTGNQVLAVANNDFS